MSLSYFPLRGSLFPLFLSLTTTIACHDYGTGVTTLSAATVDVAVAHTELEVGQQDAATAIVRDQYGAPIDAGPVVWSSTFVEVAGISPTTGEILAIAPGNTEIVATIGGKVGRQRITVSPPPILVNEVFPNGDLPGGWVELYNPTARAIDLAGWTVSNADLSSSFTFPAGVTIEAGGYAAVNEVTLPHPLNATDAVHVFNKFGVQSDSFSWAANVVGTSYGRCANGLGGFVTIQAPTRKAPNTCP
jgi:hypothetical protein